MEPTRANETGEAAASASLLPTLLAAFWRRRFWLVLALGGGALFGVLFGAIKPNQYQSVGKLFVRSGMRESLASYTLVTGAEASSRVGGARESIQTAMQVLSAPELIDRIVQRVGIDEILAAYDPAGDNTEAVSWHTALFHDFQSWWFGSAGGADRLGGEDRMRIASRLLATSLTMVPEAGASVIAFSGLSHSPRRAQALVNAGLDAATEWYRDVFRSMSSLAELEGEAKSAGDLALEAEKQLRDFRIEHGINDYEAQHDSLVGYIDEVNRRIDTVDIGLKGAEAELSDLAEQLKSINPRRTVAGAQSVALNPAYTRLNEILGDLWAAAYELERAEGDPQSKRDRKDKLDRQIADVEKRLADETVQVHLPGPEEENPDFVRVTQRVIDLDSSSKRLQSERGQLVITRDAARTRLRAIEDQAPRLRVLEENFRQKRTFADRLATSVHDERAVERLDQMKLSDVRVMHYGTLDDQKISPRRGQLVVIGMFGGICCGLALVALSCLRDRRIRVAEDLVRLGVPKDGILSGASPSSKDVQTRLPDSLADSRGEIARFWAALPYDRRATDCLRIAFLPSSAQVNVGRAAAALAIGLAAHGGERVVYVSTQSGPTWLAQRLGLDDQRGWSEVVRGELSLDQAIVPTSLAGLDYLPAGVVGDGLPHPMASAAFVEILGRMTARHRFVIIELPDVLRMPEARSVLGAADAVQLVARLGKTEKAEVREALAAIASSGVRLLGAVVQPETDAVASRA